MEKQKLKPKVHGYSSLILERFPGYFLLAGLLIAGGFVFFVFQPFLGILVLAAILATAFYPLYNKILFWFKGRSRLAALVTCLIIFFLVIVPLIFFVLLLTKQAAEFYLFAQNKILSGEFDSLLKWQKGNIFYDLLDPQNGQFASFIDVRNFDLKQTIIDASRTVSGFLITQTTRMFKGLVVYILGFLLMFFSMYYIFRDGKKILQKLMKISPLPLRHELELFRKFNEISRVTLVGVFLTALAQGLVGGVGFFIVGVPNAAFWGTAMAIFSLIPLVGTSIIWLPAGLLLLLSGNLFGGIFILLWGACLVSTVDNFLRAYLIGKHADIHPLLAFLAVLGGIAFFDDLSGIIFGPLALTLFFTFLHIYELEYKDVLGQKS